jgi:hypothetical protein
MRPPFTAFPPEWEATRSTLHAYARAVGVIPRALATPHHRFWHLGLTVDDRGATTAPMALPNGDPLAVRVDLVRHRIVVTAGDIDVAALAMDGGASATAIGERLTAVVADLDASASYERSRYEDDAPRPYDRDAAAALHHTLLAVAGVLEQRRAEMEGDVGPLHLWPHGFDLAFEWYGTRVVSHTEGGEARREPAQLNVGFSPREPAYFYSNPWPFETERLQGAPLPHGARWHVGDWEGSILEYQGLVDDPAAGAKLLEYLRAVYQAARPTLVMG